MISSFLNARSCASNGMRGGSKNGVAMHRVSLPKIDQTLWNLPCQINGHCVARPLNNFLVRLDLILTRRAFEGFVRKLAAKNYRKRKFVRQMLPSVHGSAKLNAQAGTVDRTHGRKFHGCWCGVEDPAVRVKARQTPVSHFWKNK